MALTNEDLLAISQILDVKLKPIDKKLDRLEDRMTSLEGKVTKLEERMTSLEGKVTKLEDRMTSLEGKVTKLEDRMTSLEGKVTKLEGKVTSLEDKVILLDTRVGGVESRTKKMELLLENNALPRLQNIEACYTSTYRRYAEGTEQFERIQVDVDILKKIVSEHSEKLQKLA